MNTLLLILGFEMNLIEVILFQLVAVVLGFSIHFFIASKKRFTIGRLSEHEISEEDRMRLQLYEDYDRLNEENEQLRQDLEEAHRNVNSLEVQLEELQLAALKKSADDTQGLSMSEETYLEQLDQTRNNLQEGNQQAQLLLEKIELLKGAEQKYLEAIKENEQLNSQQRELRRELTEKETQIRQIRQQYTLTRELQDRMDKAYSEFNLLQDKIQKVETYMVQPQHRTFDVEELQQSYFKQTNDFEELKLKFLHVMEENQRITRLLAEAEDKLQESNFQRQQYMKKATYLENLNNDLLKVAEHNKKLENQLRRMGEINSLLSKLSGPSDASAEPTAE